ncbi:MAG: carboxypeptidase-like regulatory domain-containing protein, partial [Bacteroidia bacterium]
MHRKLLLLFILVGSFGLLTAQQIRGIITDSVTHEPLSFVSVGIASLKQGTITNEQGRFVFYVKKNQKVTLGFGLIGYISKTILIPSVHDTF